jgi:hypothetical protein
MNRSFGVFFKHIAGHVLSDIQPSLNTHSTNINNFNPLKRIKASFAQCSEEDRKLFPHAQAQVTISVDQPIHYGAKFHATMNLVKNHFKACTIMVDDTVQRYTYAILHPEKSEEELYEMSHNKGNAWIAENIHTLSSLNIPCRVIRWEHWLNHDKFPQMLKTVRNFYDTNDEYRAAVRSSIDAYLKRFIRTHENIDHEKAFQYCEAYLQEECAGMALWPELGCQFEIYPSGRNEAMEATYQHFIYPNNPELLKIIGLRFVKKNVTYETKIDENEIIQTAQKMNGFVF